MKKSSNKGKQRVWECKHREHYYDDFVNVMLCNNSSSSGCQTCMCKSIFCVQECPFFEKSERSFYLEMTDSDQNEVKKFIDKMSDDEKKREVEERALLKYLKDKYERC